MADFRAQLQHEIKKASGLQNADSAAQLKSDTIRTVMFPFKDGENVEKYGPKNNDLAYRVMDLKFEYWMLPIHLTLNIYIYIYARQEVKARRKMLKNVLANLNKQFEKDPKALNWNPGGSRVIKRTSQQLEGYRKMARKRYLLLLGNSEFRKKVETIHHNEALVNQKMGLFRKANVFYSKQMYNDCFKTVVKAIEIIKNELEEQEHDESLKARDWRLKLGLAPGTTINSLRAYL